MLSNHEESTILNKTGLLQLRAYSSKSRGGQLLFSQPTDAVKGQSKTDSFVRQGLRDREAAEHSTSRPGALKPVAARPGHRQDGQAEMAKNSVRQPRIPEFKSLLDFSICSSNFSRGPVAELQSKCCFLNYEKAGYEVMSV
jgi:hypothetical protein